MYAVWICDDETRYLDDLRERITTGMVSLQPVCFATADAVREAAREGLPDILLMDIEFGQTSGLALVDELVEGAEKKPMVIYLSDFAEKYCQRIFTGKVKPAGYLTKPIEEAYLFFYLDSCVRELQRLVASDGVLTYYKKRVMYSVPCREIVALESKGHSIHIYDQNESRDRKFLGKLDELEEQLPKEFLRIHKSYIVNMRYIDRVERNELLLSNGKRIPISRSKREEACNRYLMYRGV